MEKKDCMRSTQECAINITIHTESNRQINTKETNYFIHSWIPKYKLPAEENLVHNPFGRRSSRGSICMPSEGLDQFMMVVSTSEARLEPPEFMPGVHLGSH